jgi:hypothetical protein
VTKEKPVIVKFVQKNAPYNIGELAGFSPEVARRLVAGGKAIFHTPEDEAEVQSAEEKAAASEVRTFTPVHSGGGWYDVGSHRVRGKDEAQKFADGLNAKSAPPKAKE